MISLEDLKELAVPAETKIVLLVMDGLGGLPRASDGKTELEAARTPNLDQLAARGNCGLLDMVGPGITPGSGPGHLGLFGYDPLQYRIGRGVLEAVGIGLDLTKNDVASRGNFCTVDAAGNIADRRAGRISTGLCVELSALLDRIRVAGAEVVVRPVKEHRFVAVFRAEGLSGELTESDPQQLGTPPLPIQPRSPEAAGTAEIVNQFVAEARKVLADRHPANMVLLRGFAKRPTLPTIPEIYGVRAASIAVYPMYRGLASLAGMEALKTGETVADEFKTLAEHFGRYDFFFLHVKKTDSSGEDGDFDRKVHVIEEVDGQIPTLMGLRPDVVVVAGDHSTPAALKMHSWHPVPALLYSRWCRPDGVAKFSERACLGGGLGRLRAPEILPLAMAHALRLTKFGA